MTHRALAVVLVAAALGACSPTKDAPSAPPPPSAPPAPAVRFLPMPSQPCMVSDRLDAKLWDAAQRGDPEPFRAARAAGRPPGDFLPAVIQYGQAPLVKELLDAGAPVNCEAWGKTPLMLAASRGHPAVVKVLLDAGAEPNACDRAGWTAYLWATGLGQWMSCEPLPFDVTGEARRVLSAAGASEEGLLELELLDALVKEKPDSARIALDCGAKLTLTDQGGRTALELAARLGNAGLVGRILREARWEQPALDRALAAAMGASPWTNMPTFDEVLVTMHLLLDAGADVRADLGPESGTLLHGAVMKDPRVFRLVLGRGADPNALIERGRYTPIIRAGYARDSRHLENIRLLLAAGAHVNAAAVNGWTALHVAARAGAWETTKTLIEADADVQARNQEGKTPRDLALAEGHRDIAGLIDECSAVGPRARRKR